MEKIDKVYTENENDIANDMNFTGNLIMSSKTETDAEKTVDGNN